MVWGGAAVGIALRQVWLDAPQWVVAVPYVVVGWCPIVVAPQLVRALGWGGFGLMLAGGLAYTAGALVYVRKRPDPWPAVFGFHEIFHACTLVGAGLFAYMVAFVALPVLIRRSHRWPSAAPPVWGGRRRLASGAFEAEHGNGVAPHDPVDVVIAQVLHHLLGHRPRVGPGGVAVRVVGLEGDAVGADAPMESSPCWSRKKQPYTWRWKYVEGGSGTMSLTPPQARCSRHTSSIRSRMYGSQPICPSE